MITINTSLTTKIIKALIVLLSKKYRSFYMAFNQSKRGVALNKLSCSNKAKGSLFTFLRVKCSRVKGTRLVKLFIYLVMIIACSFMVKPSYMYAKSIVAQLLLNHAWQKSTSNGGSYLPWYWADSHPVAKLTYAKKKHSWIILSGMTGRAMAFAPTWLEDSAKPNQYGNTVISAHNDSHFDILAGVEIGELFTLEAKSDEKVNYRVTDVNIVWDIDISPYLFRDETMITLITCYPFNVSNSPKKQRLVIQAIKEI